jgi:tetratricopeptide (TPR) repeat protein
VDYQKIVESFLPAGATLTQPRQDFTHLNQPGLVQAADLNGDGENELIAGYQLDHSAGVLVLAQGMADSLQHYGWQKIWEEKGQGHDLALLYPADVTGDGVPELLVGWTIGASAGNGLSIVGFRERPSVLAQTGYHRLDVADFPGEYGPDGRNELAIWTKDTGTAFAVDVWRYHEGKLVPAPDTYAAYFPAVVKYYEEQLKVQPEAPILWYYLADAQVRAGRPEEALKSIAKAAAYPDSSVSPASLELVRGDALYALGRYTEAERAYRSAAGTTKTAGKRILARAYYGLGRTKEAQGNLEAARTSYREALRLTPDWPDPAAALRRLEVRPAIDALTSYLQSLTPDNRSTGLGRLPWFAREHGLALQTAHRVAGDAGIELLAVDLGPAAAGASSPAQGFLAHVLFWWDGPGQDKFHAQIFYSADAAEHGLDENYAIGEVQVTSGREGKPEAALIYDSRALGSGSPRPVLYLLRLNGEKWRILWRSPEGPTWRASHGKIRFTSSDLSEFTLEGDSWFLGDGKDNIFHEANAGPHRIFLDTWKREGDAYRRVEATTLPSAYATLVELVYNLSTGREEEAAKLVTDPELLDWARALVLNQEPLGEGWQLDLSAPGPSPERRGPLTITGGPAAGVTVTFQEKDGRFLVAGFRKDGLTFIPGLARAITEYLEEGGIQRTPFGGKVFAAYQLLGTAEKNGEIHAYVWALLREIVREDAGFKVGSGSSLPLVLRFRRDPGGTLAPVGYGEPGDGAFYVPSIRRLFPPELVDLVLRPDHPVTELAAQVFLKARRAPW